VIFKANTAMN